MTDRLLSVDSDSKMPPSAVLAAWQTGFIDPGVAASFATAAATKVTKGTLRINVADYASAVAAVAAAPAGSTVYFPPGIYVNPSGLGNGIKVLADNITLELAQGAEIRVNTWGQPGIDCVGRSGITVLGGTVRYTGTRGDHTGNSGRSGALYTMCAGVFIDHDRCTVQGLRTINMPVGVFLSAWNGSSAYDYRGTGNRILNVEVEGADWGVLWMMQKALVIDGLYFHDDIDDSSGANPTHAIYCSSTDTNRSYSVTISNLITENCLYGQPYQIKYCDNLTMSNLISRASRGLLNVIGCVDLALTNANATGSLASLASPQGAITVQGLGATRHRYQNVSIEVDQTSGADHRTVLMEAQDSVIDGLTVVSKRTSSGSASNPVVQIRGLRNDARNITITETSAYLPVGLLIGGSSVDSSGSTASGRLRFTGVSTAIQTLAPGSGVIAYDRSMVSATSYTSLGASTDYAVYEDGLLTVSGTPEGAVTAPVGKVAVRGNGGAGTTLYVKESGTGDTGWRSMPKSPDVQAFTSNGTWTKPSGAVHVEVVVIGGGGGGGSGRRGAAGSVRSGGAGGGGGGITRFSLPESAVGSSVGVTIGAAGTSGAAVTTNDTNGNAGGNGGTSAFGSLARAAGGTGGAGGTNSGGAGGAGGWGTAQGSVGGTASSTGAVGGGSQQSGGPSSGASGGGITSADSPSNGAGGLGPASVTLSGPSGGVVDGAAPGAATSASTGVPLPGGGGGGGAASITTAAQAGAAGGLYGGGGSGGGASLNGNNSGAGGAGAAGIVVITTYF